VRGAIRLLLQALLREHSRRRPPQSRGKSRAGRDARRRSSATPRAGGDWHVVARHHRPYSTRKPPSSARCRKALRQGLIGLTGEPPPDASLARRTTTSSTPGIRDRPRRLETALAVNRWRLRFRWVRRHLRTGAHLGPPFFGDKLDPVRPSSDHFPVAVHAFARCEDKAMTLGMFAPQALGLRDGVVVGHGRSIARSHVKAQRPGEWVAQSAALDEDRQRGSSFPLLIQRPSGAGARRRRGPPLRSSEDVEKAHGSV
jgi:hypothetical protein